MKTQFELHGLTQAMPYGKTERNIDARALTSYFGRKQINTFVCQAGFVKKKHIFLWLVFVYVLSGRLKSRK